jgi:glycosyltransferase involved in cell wall biosynthesis
MAKVNIIHVANIKLERTAGMGRVAWEWRSAALRRSFGFVHVGSDEVSTSFHYSLFALGARRIIKKSLSSNCVLLIHEPWTWALCDFPVAKVGVSHGLESRCFKIMNQSFNFSFKSRLFQPLWTCLSLSGLARMDLVLLSNTEDRDFFLGRRTGVEVKIYRNGVYATNGGLPDPENSTIIFNASWLDRKGKNLLVNSAIKLAGRGYKLKWLLIGTGKSSDEVRSDWPSELHSDLCIVPSFPAEEEHGYLISAGIYVLPSYFEGGASLSLLQAMRAGLCCIASDCCGQKDVIRHGFNGLLFEPGNEIELSRMIERAVVDGALRTELGSNAISTVAGRTWEKVADEVMDWIEEIV